MRYHQTALFCLGCLALLAVGTAADDVDRPHKEDSAEFEEMDIDLIEIDARDFDHDFTIESGFLFIDGELMPAPYRVRLSDDRTQVLVNDREVPGAIPKLPTSQPGSGEGRRRNREGSRDEGGRWGGGRSRNREPSPNIWAGRIRQHLDDNVAIVAFTGQRMQVMRDAHTYALLKTLLEPDAQSEEFAEVMETPHGPDAAASWHQWLLSFEPDATFRRQVEPFIESFEAAEAANLAEVAAVRRFDAVAYPLTILGMLMSVIAFGHLLMSLPNNDAMRRGATEGEAGISRDVIRATMISVVLVAALSSLDLVWTLLASQAGQMRELNPIASHFISDPLSLIAFKAAATLLGCGLLYALRQHSRAQLASWWMCLVCTMLTFRWLMFNSLFVT